MGSSNSSEVYMSPCSGPTYVQVFIRPIFACRKVSGLDVIKTQSPRLFKCLLTSFAVNERDH